MKNLLVVLLSVLSILPAVGRSHVSHDVSVSTTVDMAIDDSTAYFTAQYPGLSSDFVCSLELRLNPLVFNTVDQLSDVLVVEETFADKLTPIKMIDSKTAVINLLLGRYVTTLSISTRNGRPLREVLEDLGIYKGDLILHGKSCPASY